MKSLCKNILFLIAIFSFQTAFGGQEDQFNGWAWSSNIGWISFNCTNTDSCGIVDYGVDTDLSGNLSGYAWSSHVGWINFSGVTYNSGTGALSGDANFVTADTEVDGWDNGTLRTFDTSPIAYGPVLNGSTDIFEGYAWGSDVVGWVHFNTAFGNVGLDPFSFVLTADAGLTPGDAIDVGGDVLLSWTTDGSVTSCTASNGPGTTWTDVTTKPTNGSEAVTNLLDPVTFSLTCINSSAKSITRNLPIYVQNPEPTITLTSPDPNIRSGEDVEIVWTVEDGINCVGTGPIGDWPGPKSTPGGFGGSTEFISDLSNLENTFALECDSPYPEHSAGPYISFLTVFVDKLIINFDRVVLPGEDPGAGRYGEPVELEFLVENPLVCEVRNDLANIGSLASSTLDITDYSLGELAGGAPDSDFITTSTSTTGFDIPNGDILYGYETRALFNAVTEDERREYNFTLYCEGTDDQIASSTINISVGKNPNFDER